MYNSGVVHKKTLKMEDNNKRFSYNKALISHGKFELIWDGYSEILIYKEKTVDIKNTVNTCNDNNEKI